MDKKELIILGIIIVIAVVVGGIVFAPHTDGKSTSIEILNHKEIGENGTVYVKLKDEGGNSLSNKTLHVKITDKNNKVVYEKTVKTQSTGVAIAKLQNVTSGDYNINITFEGDGNYSESTVSQKITIAGDAVDELENSTLIQETLDDADNNDDNTQNTQSQSSSSSQSSSNSHSYTPSNRGSSSSEDTKYYDENGREVLPEYDENGKLK